MTGPASVGIERGTGAPSRSTGTQGAVGAVLLVLALGLALRLIIAQNAPGSGFDVDLTSFRFWLTDLAAHGPGGFYERPFFHDYTPGYLYVLWLMGSLGNVLHWETWQAAAPSLHLLADLDLKAPAILADLAIGWLAWSMTRELGGRDRLALAAAFVTVINPVSWFDSVLWAQVDSFGVVFLLLGVRELWRDRPERAAIYTVLAALIKPQLGILIPIVAIVTIRRALWPSDARAEADDDNAGASPDLGFLDRFRAWERDTGRGIRIVTTGIVALVTVYLVCLPFGLSVASFSSTAPFFKSGLLEQILKTAGGYPYVTVNAYNPWALVVGDTGNSLANSGLWVCDGQWLRCGSGVAMFGVVPAIAVGTTLLLAVIGAILVVVARRPDRLTILLGVTILAFAFFAVPTRVHERYAYPFFALAIILAAVSWRWRIAYLAASVTIFLNMYVVLTTLYPNNPGVEDWLGIGRAIRSELGVFLIAVTNAIVMAWLLVQLRWSARERLAADLAAAAGPPREIVEPAVPEPAGPPLAPHPVARVGAPLASASAVAQADVLAPAAATMPVWLERPTIEDAGVVGWFRGLLDTRPIRPDRSGGLAGERGGRLDRLDLWLLVVLVVATMGLRTFRLAEPYQMHFDEVYHARTASEFLQDWRYGLDHYIYEWTHPHLAKYAMAAGIVLWGRDEVSATSELGTPVAATVVEPRRDDPLRRRTSRRAPARRDRHRDPHVRPADAPAHRRHGGARRDGPRDERLGHGAHRRLRRRPAGDGRRGIDGRSAGSRSA